MNEPPSSARGAFWRKVLLIPTLVRAGLRAPRGGSDAWDRYWRGIRRTGAGGQVLWDGDSAEERDWAVGLARRAMDPALPVIDVGCGNGRYTRALAPWFSAAYGVDVSAQAVAHAERETRDARSRPEARAADGPPAGKAALHEHPTFRVLDMTESGAGERLRAEVGDSNVFVRGLFHVLDAGQRRRLAESCRALVGERGALVLVETDFPGGPLSYLDFLGARGSDYPEPLLRCLEAGLPAPSRFGARELALHFPRDAWEHVEAGRAELCPVATRPGRSPRSIPAFFAVLRAKPRKRVP